MKNIRDLIIATATVAAHEWFLMQQSTPFLALYAYFRKPTGNEEICKVVVSENRPEEHGEWELITQERLNPAWTEEQCLAKLVAAMNTNLPIFNPAFSYNA